MRQYRFKDMMEVATNKRQANDDLNILVNSITHKTLPAKGIRKILSDCYLEIVEEETREAWVGFLTGSSGKLEFPLGNMKRANIGEGKITFPETVGLITITWNRGKTGYEVIAYVI